MKARLRIVALATFALILSTAGTSAALEKTTRLLNVDTGDDWRGGTTCAISYYNTCTGWLWVWGGWANGDRVGVASQNCCGAGFTSHVTDMRIYWGTGAPAGYGFTGSVDLWAADVNGCPTGPSLGTQPMLPIDGGFATATFTAPVPVPDDFIVTYTFADAMSLNNPAQIGTEHPAAGPTGPQACGSCYPALRTNRTFYYGTGASPVCPGSTLNDGVCDAQLLWDVNADCVVSVESNSWGQIKNLYR